MTSKRLSEAKFKFPADSGMWDTGPKQNSDLFAILFTDGTRDNLLITKNTWESVLNVKYEVSAGHLLINPKSLRQLFANQNTNSAISTTTDISRRLIDEGISGMRPPTAIALIRGTYLYSGPIDIFTGVTRLGNRVVSFDNLSKAFLPAASYGTELYKNRKKAEENLYRIRNIIMKKNEEIRKKFDKDLMVTTKNSVGVILFNFALNIINEVIMNSDKLVYKSSQFIEALPKITEWYQNALKTGELSYDKLKNNPRIIAAIADTINGAKSPSSYARLAHKIMLPELDYSVAHYPIVSTISNTIFEHENIEKLASLDKLEKLYPSIFNLVLKPKVVAVNRYRAFCDIVLKRLIQISPVRQELNRISELGRNFKFGDRVGYNEIVLSNYRVEAIIVMPVNEYIQNIPENTPKLIGNITGQSRLVRAFEDLDEIETYIASIFRPLEEIKR